jgi:hypothetical protein
MKIGAAKNDGIAIIANNVFIKAGNSLQRFFASPGSLRGEGVVSVRTAPARQRAALGIFGSNTASSPIAGRNAQTW